MKRKVNVFVTLFLVVGLFFVSCKENKYENQDKSTIEATEEGEIEVSEEEAIPPLGIIVDNEDKYPRKDLEIFSDEEVSKRLKTLLGDDYDEVVDNFNTETPVVSEEGIYKFTGCKEHDCPGFLTTVLYDSNKDNLNVLVEQDGKTQVFDEKGKIKATKSLRAK